MDDGDDDDDETSGGATTVTAFVRVVLDPQLRGDRYELDVRDLSEWTMRDAIQFESGPEAHE